MIFNTIERTSYKESQTIYEANPLLVLKRLPYRDRCTYTLSITSSSLQLELCNKDRKYSRTENGDIQFPMTQSEEKLDFVSIRKTSASLRGPIENFRLEVRARDEGFDHTERSGIIEFVPKQNYISPKNRQKAKDFNVPIGNLFYSFQRQMENDLLNQSDEEVTCISETYEFSDGSDDDSNFITCIPKESACQSINACFVFNMINFADKGLKTRHQSIDNVKRINNLFGLQCCFHIKEVIDATTDDFFGDLKEYVNEIKTKSGQLIIFVMSHGKFGGFYTTDGFVSEERFRESLRPILSNEKLMKIIILSYCQDTKGATNLFYLSVLKDEEEDGTIGSVNENITNQKDNENEYVKWIDPPNSQHCHLLIGRATLPGCLSYVGSSGSVYLNTMMDTTEDLFKSQPVVNFEEVVRSCANKLKNMNLKYKGVQVTQQSLCQGHLDNGFQLRNYDGDNYEEVLGDIEE